MQLRNQITLSYFIINAIFVVTVFTLQTGAEDLRLPWPCGIDLTLDPIGFMFLLFFGVILVIQTLGTQSGLRTLYLGREWWTSFLKLRHTSSRIWSIGMRQFAVFYILRFKALATIFYDIARWARMQKSTISFKPCNWLLMPLMWIKKYSQLILWNLSKYYPF